MKISKQAKREAKQLFRASFEAGVLDEEAAKSAVNMVLEEKPRGYMSILAHFKRLVQLHIQERTATVESAVPVEAPMESQLRSQLAKTYGAGLNISFVHNPALLGGMRVKVGSDVYDGTVQGRLAALQEQF